MAEDDQVSAFYPRVPIREKAENTRRRRHKKVLVSEDERHCFQSDWSDQSFLPATERPFQSCVEMAFANVSRS